MNPRFRYLLAVAMYAMFVVCLAGVIAASVFWLWTEDEFWGKMTVTLMIGAPVYFVLGEILFEEVPPPWK